MSDTTDAWGELYEAQTEAIGVAILATVGAFAVSKPAIISALDADEIIVEGGMAESGGFKLQMLESDFSAEPVKTTAVTANGSAAGQSLRVLSSNLNNGVRYLVVGDYSAL